MKRLRDWMGKLRGKRSQTNGTRPRADQFNPTQEDVAERKTDLFAKTEENDEHDPDRYDPNP